MQLNWSPPPLCEREAIASGDKEAIRNFFEQNRAIIERYSRRIIGLAQIYGNSYDFKLFCPDDVTNQIYADLQYYNLESSLSFFIGMRGSLNNIAYGGFLTQGRRFRRCASLDAPLYRHSSRMEESKFTLADIICGDCDLFDTCFPADDGKNRDYAQLLTFMEENIKDKCKLNYIFCKVFTNLEDNEITGGEYESFKPFV